MRIYKVRIEIKIFVALIVAAGFWNYVVTLQDRDVSQQVFNLLGTLFIAAALWVVARLSFITTSTKVVRTGIPQWMRREPLAVEWDKITRFTDDNYLCVHVFWATYPDPKNTDKLIHDYLSSNWLLANNDQFLADVITHLKPGTEVDASILTATNLTHEDIGRFYQKDEWPS